MKKANTLRNQRQKRINKSSQGSSASCWCCGNSRSAATLKIIGKQRLLCDDCSRLAEQDVELQGRLRELFGYMTWEGIVPNKHHRKVSLLCRHRLPQISGLAEEILTETVFQREMSMARREHENELLESIVKRHEAWGESRDERLGEEIAERF